MTYPDTIWSPDSFDRSTPAGFDGIFNWKWTEGCFTGKIEPMDFDGVVERNHHFLVMETKDVGKQIDQGQQITLDHLMAPKSFCVMRIWGKNEPQYFEATYLRNGTIQKYSNEGVEKAREFVKWWFTDANSRG